MKTNLKRWMLFVALMVMSVSAGADVYEVTAKMLNVRATPSGSGMLVAKLTQGTQVNVDYVENGWAHIVDVETEGYASAKYLKLIEVSAVPELQTATEAPDKEDFVDRLREKGFTFMDGFFTHNARWPVYVCVILGIILLIMNFGSTEESLEDGALFVKVKLGIFLIMCIMEIIYFQGYSGDKTWFCSPDDVGWIWTIINFFLFCGATVGQMLIWVRLLYETNAAAGFYVDWRWLGGSVIAAIVLLIIGIFWSPALYIAAIIFFGFQIGWPFYMAYQCHQSGGNWLLFGLALGLYVLGLFSIILMLVFLLPLLIVALGIYIGLQVLAHMPTGSQRLCPTCGHYSWGYCNKYNRSVNDNNYCSAHT